MNTVLKMPKPNPKQALAMKAQEPNICFGGARGGGKSWMVRWKAILLCLFYAGIRILIVRKTYAELEENHIRVLRPLLYGIAKYNQTNKRFTFENGSTITFKQCNIDKDLTKFQGTEWDTIFIDEATNLRENQLKDITATCRGTNNFPKRIYYTCNPGGEGHAYIKRLFIDRAFDESENPDDYIFIQSFVTDNTALMENDPQYYERLKRLPPKRRQAWLEGKWDIFEGQFFEEFTDDSDHYSDRRFTHVIEPFEIPHGWTIYRSFDWGYSKPFSCDWWAVDYDGRAYLILQYYGSNGQPNEGCKMQPYELFKQIREIEDSHRWLKGKYISGVADPAIWDAEYGESIADIAEKFRIHFDKADNSRINGWMQCHYRFEFDENGYPMVYFFNTCKHAIRTIPLLMYSETKVEDLNTELEDHFADSFRYFCMSRPLAPIEIKTGNKKRMNDPLDMIKDSLNKRYAGY